MTFIFDTMVAAHVLDESQSKNLKILSAKLRGYSYDYVPDFNKPESIDYDKLYRYCGQDANNTFWLFNKFLSDLKKDPQLLRLYRVLYPPVLRAFEYIEMNGIWIDEEKLDRKIAELTEKKNQILNKMNAYFPGEKINFNSHDQLAEVLFHRLNLPVVSTTKTKKSSTDKFTLLKLQDKHPFVADLLQYDRVEKDLNSFLIPWKGWVYKGRIRPKYDPTGTITGRGSCEDPNLQQTPRASDLRTLYGAPPGKLLGDLDLDQIELKVIAIISGDPEMLRVFKSGGDLHSEVAAMISGKKIDEITKDERRKAKGADFGLVYGMQDNSLQTYVEERFGIPLTLREAKIFYNRFFNRFKGVRAWHEREKRNLIQNYEVVSLLGRKRRFHHANFDDKKVWSGAERQAINFGPQSFASDYTFYLLGKMFQEVDLTKAFPVDTIHDSILWEIDENEVDYFKALVNKYNGLTGMPEFELEFPIPLTFTLKISKYWGEE